MQTRLKRPSGRLAGAGASLPAYRKGLWLLGTVVAMAGCGEAMVHPTGQSPGAAPTALQTSALAQFNRGGALMEQYRYAEASKAYEAVLDLAPAWVAARFNLGVAYFNMHGQRGGQENLDAARQVFETILASAPGHLHARFCLGLYHQHVGDDEKALEHFQRVRQADATDPHAAYKCAEALVALGRNEEGTTMLEHVIALDPGFVSAVYRLALQYQRTGQRDGRRASITPCLRPTTCRCRRPAPSPARASCSLPSPGRWPRARFRGNGPAGRLAFRESRSATLTAMATSISA